MRFLLVLFLLFVSTGFVQAVEQIDSAYKQTAASYTNYRDCIRLYKLPFEKLFSLSLASINENKYEEDDLIRDYLIAKDNSDVNEDDVNETEEDVEEDESNDADWLNALG